VTNVRHCCQCNRNVYDLTAMDPDEAEAFLDAHLATAAAASLFANRPVLGPDDALVVEDRELSVRAHDVEPAHAEMGELELLWSGRRR
jgi:hypothetical protein